MSSNNKILDVKDDGKPALPPKLRFPEFWGQTVREIELREITAESTLRNGKTLPASVVMGVSKVNGIVPMEERIVASNIARYKLVQKDWFAYNPMRLNIGSIARWKGDSDILVSPDYIVFRCLNDKEPGIHSAFLDQFRQSFAWENFVTQGGDGGVRVRIYYKDIGNLKLTLPTLAEQQKIAECLNSVDELISVQSRKVDALKSHKKGLMQQLFLQEGETQPHLRFPEFGDTGEWKNTELGPKASKVGSGITPTGGDKNYKRKGRPFVRSQNVGWGTLLLDDIVFLDELTHASFVSTEIKIGDVLLNITGASIGRSSVADARVAGGNVNQHVCIIRTKFDVLSPFFLNQFLLCQLGQQQIDSCQAGGNRQGLNFAQIRSFTIPLPPMLEEQKRIADCLTALDDLIGAETQKLDTLKTHKKGLMQLLFPQVGER